MSKSENFLRAFELRTYPKTSNIAVASETSSGKAALAAGMLEAYPGRSERGQSPFQKQPLGAESLMALNCVLLENKYSKYSLFKHALFRAIRVLSGGIRGFGIGSIKIALRD